MPLFKLSDGQVHFSSLLITFSTTEICIEIYKCILIDLTISQYPKLYCFKDVFFSILSFLLSLFWKCPYLLHFRPPTEMYSASSKKYPNLSESRWPTERTRALQQQNVMALCVNSSELVQCLQRPFLLCLLWNEFPSCSQPKYPPKKWCTNNSAPFFRVKQHQPPPLHQRGKKKRSKLHLPPVRKLPCSWVTVLRQTRYPIVAPSPGRRKTAWTQSNDLDQIAYELRTEYIYIYIYWIYCMYIICECNTLREMCIYIIRGIHSAGWIFSRSCRLGFLWAIWAYGSLGQWAHTDCIPSGFWLAFVVINVAVPQKLHLAGSWSHLFQSQSDVIPLISSGDKIQDILQWWKKNMNPACLIWCFHTKVNPSWKK